MRREKAYAKRRRNKELEERKKMMVLTAEIEIETRGYSNKNIKMYKKADRNGENSSVRKGRRENMAI